MRCTRGQGEGFWGGVRASAKRRPPGAEDSQMCGGMGTNPVGPTPLAATERSTVREECPGPGEVSEDCESGRDRASL